ncbi:hypothetical protein ACLBKT_07545 [Erythrobacter sp. W302b]|uniref:hypothetical protein n=1 Tax=Erythrobacter sp. W302b TaxID=3389874 RepID=UPI00396B0510
MAWMIPNGIVLPVAIRGGQLSWSRGDEPAGRIGCTCDMFDPEQSSLMLQFALIDHACGEARDFT